MKFLSKFIFLLVFILSCNENEKVKSNNSNKEEDEKITIQKGILKSKIKKYNPIVWDDLSEEMKIEDKFSFELNELLVKNDKYFLIKAQIFDIVQLNDSLFVLECQIENSYLYDFFCNLKIKKKMVNQIQNEIKRDWHEAHYFIVKFRNLKSINFQLNQEVEVEQDLNYEMTIDFNLGGGYILAGDCIDYVHLDKG